MVAAFAAAYMSTIATQLNWGASYLINDFYRRFLNDNATEDHYVRASQLATVLITIVSAVVTFYMDSIAGAWKLLILTGAGTGSVLLLALVLVAHQRVERGVGDDLRVRRVGRDADRLRLRQRPARSMRRGSCSSRSRSRRSSGLLVTFLTKPESKETLVAFYRRTAPSLTGWRPIAALAPDVKPRQDGLSNLLDWICGCVLIYGVLFGVGKLLLQETVTRLGSARVGHCSRRRYLLGSLPPRLVSVVD